MYIATALFFATAALAELLMMRLQLMVPENSLIRPEIFDRLLSAYGITALMLFALPLAIGLLSIVLPLQIGARGMALPRLHHLSYWLYLFGGVTVYASFLYRPSEAGVIGLPPLSSSEFLPGAAVDAWIDRLRPGPARSHLLLGEHDRHDQELQGPRDGAAADAALRLGRFGGQLHPAHRQPDLPGRARDADARSPLRRRLLRPRRGWQAAPLRAPRLDLPRRRIRIRDRDRARRDLGDPRDLRTPAAVRPSRDRRVASSPSQPSPCSAGCRACTRPGCRAVCSTSRC